MNTLRSELQKLSTLVDGWNAPEEITALERDLALEKLRVLYEILRFDAHTASAEQYAEAEMTLGIDLGEVLSLGLIPDAGEVEADTEPTPIAEPALPEDSSDAAASATSPFLEAAPAKEAQTPAVSQPTLASLFGVDRDETINHRRKQRVIMSLYDNEAPASAPAVEEEVGAEFEEFSVETENALEMPANEPTPADDIALAIAPADESFGGEEPTPEAPVELDDPTPEAPESPDAPVEAETSAEPVAFALPDMTAEPKQPVVPGGVLGEVINHDVQTLADTYAAHPVSEAAHRTPVGNLRSAIGLNDRFLLIRDLFGGDAEACDAALDVFNGFENLDDCMIHIAENYSWNPDSDGAKFLIELLERKYV